MLKLQNIEVTLAKNELASQVLKKLNLTIKNGEFVVVIGENGAGKSTLFNVISGYLKPQLGQVFLDGKDVTKVPQNLRASLVAVVMQDPKMGTIENMTIFENMAFALKRGQKRKIFPFCNENRKQFIAEKLSKLGMGLENRFNDLVGSLSGGQRQALSLIMAVSALSKILLLDEITAALDPKIAKTVMELTDKIIREEKLTCIMITHNMKDALKYGDRLVILKEGNIVKEYGYCDKQKLTADILASEFEV